MKKRQLILPVAATLLSGIVLTAVFWPQGDSSKERDSSDSKPNAASRSSSDQLPASPQKIKIETRALADFDRKAIERVTDSPEIEIQDVSLAQILSYQADSLPVKERVALLRDGIPLAELEAIYAFLKTERVPANMSMQQYHWLIDELVGALRRQPKLGSELSTQLSEIVQDQNRDGVVRDYAIQHLGHLHEGNHGINRAQIESTLWQVLDHAQTEPSALAGAALVALRNAHRDSRLTSDRGLARMATTIAADDQQQLPSRISAMAVASALGTQVDGIARDLLSEKSTPALLKVSAISALSESSADQALLKSLSYSTDSRLRVAARQKAQSFQTSQ